MSVLSRKVTDAASALSPRWRDVRPAAILAVTDESGGAAAIDSLPVAASLAVKDAAVLYTRELPGGGYVAIEALPAEGAKYRARISVERRTDPARRVGHLPPVIAEAEGASRTSVFNELYRIASDNVAVARGILRWQADRSDR
jgi:hypothetical protein